MGRRGSITIPGGMTVWQHEFRTAQALAAAGHEVVFVPKSDAPHERTADIIMDGETWEMKAPKSGKLKMVEQNLRRAMRQSVNVVFDCRRMKDVPDAAVEREVRKWAGELRRIRHVIFVDRRGRAIDIK